MGPQEDLPETLSHRGYPTEFNSKLNYAIIIHSIVLFESCLTYS